MKEIIEFLNRIKWKKQLCFLFLVSITIPFYINTHSFFNHGFTRDETTQNSIKIWLILVDLVIMFMFYRLNQPLQFIIAYVFGIGFFSILFTSIIPKPIDYLEHNYEGIEYQLTLATHEEEMEDSREEVPNDPPEQAQFFPANSQVLKNELEFARSENEKVWTEKFYFWQSAYLYNFYSEEKGYFFEGVLFRDTVSWFFLIGPPIILEIFFEGMLFYFIVALIYFTIFALLKKEGMFVSFT